MRFSLCLVLSWSCSPSPSKTIHTETKVLIDSAVDTATTTFRDSDGDGFAPDQGDCHDNDATIYPQAPDIPQDGIDQDCNGLDNTADPQNGAIIFAENCTGCHFDGGFDISVGTSSNYQVYLIIKYGFGAMPSFFSTLSDPEIFDVLLYVRENHNE